MKILIQRVKEACVFSNHVLTGEIEQGLLVFLGIHKDDVPEDTAWLVNKMINLRIFQDNAGKMNLSVQDVAGGILVVSQFTLCADCSSSRRPDFFNAAPPSLAEPIYHKFIKEAENVLNNKIQTGIFGAHMEVSLTNDGPVTIFIESPQK